MGWQDYNPVNIGHWTVPNYESSEQPQKKSSTENFVKGIRNRTSRIFTSEQKIVIVMEAIRGESPIPEVCRNCGINQAQFYRCKKEFLEAGKKRFGETTISMMKYHSQLKTNPSRKACLYFFLLNLYKCGERCAPMLRFSSSFFSKPRLISFFGKLLISSFLPSIVSYKA